MVWCRDGVKSALEIYMQQRNKNIAELRRSRSPLIGPFMKCDFYKAVFRCYLVNSQVRQQLFSCFAILQKHWRLERQNDFTKLKESIFKCVLPITLSKDYAADIE
jgi:hypothetical protein